MSKFCPFLQLAVCLLALFSVPTHCLCKFAPARVPQEDLSEGLLYLLNEGLSSDERFFYVTGHQSIVKTQLTDFTQIVDKNLYPIPPQYELSGGYNHVGDIAVVGDVMYAPIENFQFENASIFIYNISAGMPFVNSFFTAQHHCPWVAANTKKQVLYSSEFDNASVIHQYSMRNGLQELAPIKLSQTLQGVQGGDMFEGMLYLSMNPPSPSLVAVNVTSGKVSVVISKPIPQEAEGLTFVDLSKFGKGQLHIMNGHSVVAGKFSTVFHYDVTC